MVELATSRLNDAADTLPPVERALLNLWVRKGLDDQALARMTGMTAEALLARRERIVEHLSASLELPATEVTAALAGLAAGASPAPAPPAEDQAPNGAVGEPPVSGNGSTPHAPEGQAAAPEPEATEATPVAEPAPEPETAAGSPAETPSPAPEATAAVAQPRRRRFIWALLTALVVLVILLVVLLAGGGHGRTAGSSSTAASASTPTSTSASASSTASAPAAPVTRVESLVQLPGGLTGVTGSVGLIGSGSSLGLELRVSQLPAAHHAHYEVWLYNSIIDATALGRLPAGTRRLRFPLPAGASSYGFIDVSVQPTGVVNPSGESVLRAVNPAKP